MAAGKGAAVTESAPTDAIGDGNEVADTGSTTLPSSPLPAPLLLLALTSERPRVGKMSRSPVVEPARLTARSTTSNHAKESLLQRDGGRCRCSPKAIEGEEKRDETTGSGSGHTDSERSGSFSQ